MKKHFLFLPLFVGFVISCSSEVSKTDILNELKVNFVKTLSNPSVSEDENGNLFITQDETTFSFYKDNIFLGDLDDDYTTDIAYSIGVNNGGNIEEFIHLAVVSSISKEIEMKLAPNSKILGVDGKKILIKTYDWAYDDPSCCPSVETTKRFGFIGNKIVEID